MKHSFATVAGKIFLAFGLLILTVGCNNRSGHDRQVDSNTGGQDADNGKKPWVLDIEEATIANSSYRAAKWTGEKLQMVLMSLKPGEIIDLEIHDDHDQFIRIEQGEGTVFMGKSKDNLDYERKVSDDWAIFIPAGYWHQVKNNGNSDLKLYTIYAPSEHPKGTVHSTYQDAKESHH